MSIMEHMEFWNIASVENKLSVNREFFMKIYASVKQELKTKSIYLKAKIV